MPLEACNQRLQEAKCLKGHVPVTKVATAGKESLGGGRNSFVYLTPVAASWAMLL